MICDGEPRGDLTSSFNLDTGQLKNKKFTIQSLKTAQKLTMSVGLKVVSPALENGETREELRHGLLDSWIYTTAMTRCNDLRKEREYLSGRG